MHASVMNFVASILRGQDLSAVDVLEVGSYNVNGSVREVIEPMKPRSYLGIDMRPGPGVDRAMRAEDLLYEYPPGHFGLVVCCELLEHAEDWRAVVRVLREVTAPGGVLILTTRSPGFQLHEYPGDFWRFTVEDMMRIWADWEGIEIRSDEQAPGVFVAAERPQPWQEIEPARVPGGGPYRD